MALSGYSGTPLLQKLGIKEKMRLMLIDAPKNYYELLQAKISHQLCKKQEVPDLVHLFVVTNKQFEDVMKRLEPYCKQNTQIIIWVSWYKKSAGMNTDLSEDRIRDYALKHGLVDIKVCAVSELWSGLKLVVPLAKR